MTALSSWMAFYEDGFAVLGNHCIDWRTGKVLRELERTKLCIMRVGVTNVILVNAAPAD